MEKSEKLSVTESQLEKHAESNRLNGDYNRAYKELGVSPEEIILDIDQKPETSPKIGPCVNLGERAIHLSKALDSYAQSSRLKGFNKVSPRDEKINKRYSPVTIAAIGSAQDSTRWAGDNEFAKAFGVDAMAESGMEPGYARAISQINAGKFFDEYTGPSNRKKLAKYRKILKK
jgi:hypothetical protein